MNPSTRRLAWREFLPVFGVAAGYGCLVYWIAAAYLQHFPNSADEFAYGYQAHTFALGKTWNEAHPLQEVLSPFFIHTHENKVFSIFPPGWALTLCVGVMVSAPWIINPVIAAVTVILLYAVARFFLSPLRSWMVLMLWMSSPMVLLNSASLFSHPFCSLLILCAVFFLLQSLNRNRVVDAVCVGFFCAAALCTRELTATALCVLPLFYTLYRSQKRMNFILAGLAGAFPLLIFYGWYCAQITGYWFYPPRYLLPDEYLGFGWREIRVFDYVERQYHGPKEALSIMSRNILLLIQWTTLCFPMISLALFDRYLRNRWMMVFTLASVLLFCAYCLYPSDGGNQYGPRFYYEALPFFALTAVYALPDRSWWRQRFQSKAAIGIIVVFAGIFVLIGYSKLNHTRNTIYARTDLFRQVQFKNLSNALVFVAAPSGDMTQGDLIRNLPEFHQAKVIYAWDAGARRNAEVMHHFPDRMYYRYHASETGGFRVLSLYPPSDSISASR